MSTTVPATGDIRNPSSLIAAMGAVLRSYWDEAEGYQKLLYGVGALLLASAVFHGGVLIATGGSLEGPVSWRKPILFGESFGVTAVSIAWVMTFLPRRRARGWLLGGALSLTSVGEVFLVSLQQWRGVPSHFNYSTPFDAAVFNTMGVLVVFAEITIIVVAVWTLISLQAPASLAWAIRAGMTLLVASQIFGNLIIQNGIPKVIDFETGAFIREGLASTSVFGAAGSMKVPHALSLHGIQVLPLLAFLLQFSNWDESTRTRTVGAATVGYAGLVAVSALQTFRGLAAFDLSLLAAAALGASALLVAAGYALALNALRQTVARDVSGQITPAG